MRRALYKSYADKQLNNKKISRAVSKLKEHGWISKKKEEDQVYYELTKQGRIQHSIFRIKTFTRTMGKTGTIVLFDIPEEKRTFRNFIRRLLGQMDFTMLQRSIFITPHIVPEEFYSLLREMKILQYFIFIEGKMLVKK